MNYDVYIEDHEQVRLLNEVMADSFIRSADTAAHFQN